MQSIEMKKSRSGHHPARLYEDFSSINPIHISSLDIAFVPRPIKPAAKLIQGRGAHVKSQ